MKGLFTRVIFVIKEHRKLLERKESPTGRWVGHWAKIMVIPQFLLMPLTLFLGVYEGLMIFLARFLAMHIVYLLDLKIPFTRALGLCHLLSFGPLWLWFTYYFESIFSQWGAFGFLFTFEYAVISLCLYLDLRDLILHIWGKPYPCYIRDYHRLGINQIDDPRANQPVSLFSIFFW